MNMLHMLLALAVMAQSGTNDSVGMVLHVDGDVTVVRMTTKPEKASTPVRAMTLLKEGDVIHVPADAACTLFVFETQTRQTLKEGHTATIKPNGGEPADAIERQQKMRQAQPRITPALKTLCASGKAATIVARGPQTPIVIPVPGSRVLSASPSFDWQHVDESKASESFRLDILDSSGNLLWSQEHEETQLDYPARHAPLLRGRKYTWKVYSDQEQPLFAADFFVAGETIAERLSEVAELAKSDDPAEQLLAATTLHAARFHGEAIPLYERVLKTAPNQPMVKRALADCYEAAGLKERAAAARKAADDVPHKP